MTHEQKPESAAFRTQEAQIASHFGPHFLADFTEEGLRKELIEAEARGAAEQRRKDAEGAEFRPLEVQVSECSADLRASLTALDEKLYSEFVEAELRGAAWQRQTDAEDNEIARWQAFECGRGWFDISNDERSQYGDHIRPLYTRPANVAALEARVKELEGVVRGYLEASDLFDACAMICPPKALFEAKDTAMHHLRAAAIREGEQS